MYFVINGFITVVCIIALILFTEVFPKVIKALIGLLATITSSYAITLLIRKIAELTSWYAQPNRFPLCYYVFAGCAVLALLIAFIASKKAKKKK